MDVLFVTDTHELGPHSRRAGENKSAPIKVGNGVWIGARAVILPGISIGDGVVIASGAVVAADCENDGLYAGVPARRIKTIEQ
ncbi:DapH/DapD/GlmU-related protein [Gordonia alkanivorans]|uniref:DapH/DapD/GlmU-related protein n=1 Tax=Gordonia alkanivorans TaxID=84096 RepID=UPI003CC6CBDB